MVAPGPAVDVQPRRWVRGRFGARGGPQGLSRLRTIKGPAADGHREHRGSIGVKGWRSILLFGSGYEDELPEQVVIRPSEQLHLPGFDLVHGALYRLVPGALDAIGSLLASVAR